MDIYKLVSALFLPPHSVFLQKGIGKHYWLSLVLTMLFFIPGIIHAFYVLTLDPAHKLA